MIECKCCKNLFGFAASRPPCFVFTVCLAAFAIGLFSLGYFVQVYGWFDDVNDIQNKEWHSFLNHLASSEFCIFGNQTLRNATFVNSTNMTAPTPAGFTTVTVPVLDLFFTPSKGFGGVVNNVTHITVETPATELGLTGPWGNFMVNMTLTLSQPWTMGRFPCTDQKDKVNKLLIFQCSSQSLPAKNSLSYCRSKSACNMSSEDVSIVQMNNVKKHATTVHQDDQQCINGIKAETALPLNDHKSPTGTMSLADASAVNLRLQYSSYFLFVLVITCILYGMIKGRPGKQNFNKKVSAL
ncbi:unnamed protein product [Porites evermanni]|uniref:TMEM248/TMEM219 domain-containing protein n=1 Tax=Porites evermanni TaxID=104178 RepID=A0ABN8LVC3_9CNID|nr:unnamed protein product [Porites evermanni]